MPDMIPSDVIMIETVREKIVDGNGASEFLELQTAATLNRVARSLGMHKKVLRALGGKDKLASVIVDLVKSDFELDEAAKKARQVRVPMLVGSRAVNSFIKETVQHGLEGGVAYGLGKNGLPDAFALAVIQEITPMIAITLLRRREAQRSVSTLFVDILVRELLGGKFVPIGNSVKLGPEGELVDAQHRLCAIIKSGISAFWIPLVILPDGSWIERIDSQQKIRQPNDIREIRGQGKIASQVIAGVIQEAHDFKHIQTGNAEKNDIVNASPYVGFASDLLNGAKQALGTRGVPLPTAGYLGGAIRCAKESGDEAAARLFFGHAFTGEKNINGVESVAAQLLFKCLIGGRGKRGGGQPPVALSAALSITAWNSWRRGTSPRSLSLDYPNKSYDANGNLRRASGSPSIPKVMS